jgi:hypothetical protein
VIIAARLELAAKTATANTTGRRRVHAPMLSPLTVMKVRDFAPRV